MLCCASKEFEQCNCHFFVFVQFLIPSNSITIQKTVFFRVMQHSRTKFLSGLLNKSLLFVFVGVWMGSRYIGGLKKRNSGKRKAFADKIRLIRDKEVQNAVFVANA